MAEKWMFCLSSRWCSRHGMRAGRFGLSNMLLYSNYHACQARLVRRKQQQQQQGRRQRQLKQLAVPALVLTSRTLMMAHGGDSDVDCDGDCDVGISVCGPKIFCYSLRLVCAGLQLAQGECDWNQCCQLSFFQAKSAESGFCGLFSCFPVKYSFFWMSAAGKITNWKREFCTSFQVKYAFLAF